MHLTEPRVTPLPPSEWDDETRELMESLRRNGHVYNIFATLARHPQLLIGPDAPGLDSFEATLLRAVDELHTNSFICDSTWKALTERYNTQQVFDFLFTAGQYKLVSMVLNSAGVQLEEGFEGFSNETQG